MGGAAAGEPGPWTEGDSAAPDAGPWTGAAVSGVRAIDGVAGDAPPPDGAGCGC